MCSSSTPRILIVDDLPDNRFLLQVFLELEGYNIVTADSGTQALELIPHSRPDLVLLDVMMPELDGLEVTQRLRQNPDYSSLPILLITAHETVDLELSLNRGANGLIRKPFNFDNLLTQVQETLATHSPVNPFLGSDHSVKS